MDGIRGGSYGDPTRRRSRELDRPADIKLTRPAVILDHATAHSLTQASHLPAWLDHNFGLPGRLPGDDSRVVP
jgi:hypothetical protein